MSARCTADQQWDTVSVDFNSKSMGTRDFYYSSIQLVHKPGKLKSLAPLSSLTDHIEYIIFNNKKKI